MRGTIYAIRDHFLIVLALIVADLALKGVPHLGRSLLDSDAVDALGYILRWFLVGVVLIFTVFSCLELLLNGVKSLTVTFNRLFRPSPNETVELSVQNEETT